MSLRQRLRVLRDDAGMSVTELVIGITLFALILGAVLSALDSGTSAERGQQARHSALLELRGAMTTLTKELREATVLDPLSTATQLKITTMVNGVATPVTYALVETSPGVQSLRRTVGTQTATVVTNMIITEPYFCYSYDSLAQHCDRTTPPAVPTAIRITLAKDPEFNPGEPITLATDIDLRNI